MTIEFVYYTDEGDEVEATLPTRWEICWRCDGDGSIDCWEGGMTGDEMAEQGPEFMEDYLSGMYSRACYECRGDGKTRVPDLDRADPVLLAHWQAEQDAEAEYRAEQAAEIRAGC